MTLWLDNQLPPALAAWMRTTLSVACVPVRDLNLRRVAWPTVLPMLERGEALVELGESIA